MNTIYRLFTILMLSTLITACDVGDILSSGVGTDIPAGTASVGLRWDIPSTKVDGSPIMLSEVGGYRVYASTSSNGNYLLVADITDVTENHYTLDGTENQYMLNVLAPGAHYFYIITYDVNDDESPHSNIVEATVV